jgi:Ca-activated chloride channel family protein
MPEAPEVQEQVALLMVARAQKEAARAAERGDFQGTRNWLGTARGYGAVVPGSAEVQCEMAALDALEGVLDANQRQAFIKGSKYRSHRRQQTRSPEPPKPPGE